MIGFDDRDDDEQVNFDAAVWMIERWRKRLEEIRSRVAYLESALLGCVSNGENHVTAAEAEAIIAGGPGRRETQPVNQGLRFVCCVSAANFRQAHCGKPAPRFYYGDSSNPLCDEHANEYRRLEGARKSIFERCARCGRTFAPEHAAKYNADYCWLNAQAVPQGFGANSLADFHQAMVNECSLVAAKRVK